MRDEEIGDIVESRINVKLIENRLSATCFENGLVQQIRACLRVADEILWSMWTLYINTRANAHVVIDVFDYIPRRYVIEEDKCRPWNLPREYPDISPIEQLYYWLI